jgi:Protein of unknown function (DUF4245)
VAEQPAQEPAQEAIPPTAEGRPGRYQRSIGGGVAAMLVLVLGVLAFVGLRSLTRDNAEVPVDPVDYLSAARAAQGSGLDAVYPPSLPTGWTATSIDFVDGGRPAWGIGMLTGDGRFVGVRQEDADVSTLVTDYVDPDAVEGDVAPVSGALAPQWQEWSDAGGDHAFSATVGGDTVLVYGSAPTADLLTIVKSLTDAPL